MNKRFLYFVLEFSLVVFLFICLLVALLGVALIWFKGIFKRLIFISGIALISFGIFGIFGIFGLIGPIVLKFFAKSNKM